MSDPGASPLLDVTDLRTLFHTPRGVVRAVDGVSLRLERGQALGIVGESGSGKTILLRSIMGLLPRHGLVRSGSVRLDGTELAPLDPRALARLWGPKIAMVFQDPMSSLNPVIRIGRQLTEGMRYHLRMSRPAAERRALELLDLVGVPDPRLRLRQYPHQLSGGLRQRVLIACAISCEPQLLLADEPTTALDVTVEAQVLDLLFDLQRQLGMGLILVTHDMGVAADRTDDIAVMYAGKVVEQAPTTALVEYPRMPYSQALLGAIPALDQPVHTRLHAIPGIPPSPINLPPGCAFAPRCRYAQNRCREQEPGLASDGPADHRYACWFPLGTARVSEAARRPVGSPGDAR